MTDNSVSQARARVSRATIAACAALVVLSTAGMKGDARHATSFVPKDLKTLGGNSSAAFAVNDKGLVVGRSTIGIDPDVFHAFVWSEDTGLLDLGTLDDGIQSTATAINDNGVIAGFGPSESGGPNHAFVKTHANGFVDLLTLGGSTSSPTAINAKSDVVGFSDIARDSTFHAFLWTRQDLIRDLGTLGGSSMANAISDSGIVVGESASHAFMWTRRNGMRDLGTLGGFTSAAQAVSNDGVIVGNSQTNLTASDTHFINHAFVWTKQDKMVDIGSDPLFNSFDSFAEKISGRFVVGHITKDKVTHGFIWTRKGGLVDIGTLPGDTGSLVTGVNDRGLVIGNSFGGTQGSRAFVWSASSKKIVQLDSPLDGPTEADAINGNFIVGSSCLASDVNICHATLWTPAPHSRKDRDRDDDD